MTLPALKERERRGRRDNAGRISRRSYGYRIFSALRSLSYIALLRRKKFRIVNPEAEPTRILKKLEMVREVRSGLFEVH